MERLLKNLYYKPHTSTVVYIYCMMYDPELSK